MAEIRRHTLYLSDREILVLEHAVLAYAAVMRIQGTTESPKEEADTNVKASALIQEHRHCTCISNPEGG